MTWSQNWRLFRLSGRLEASMKCCFWVCRKAINWFDSKTKLTSVFCITKCLISYLLRLESKLYFDEFEWRFKSGRAQHWLNVCTEIQEHLSASLTVSTSLPIVKWRWKSEWMVLWAIEENWETEREWIIGTISRAHICDHKCLFGKNKNK